MTEVHVAKWRSKSGKYGADLFRDDNGCYHYTTPDRWASGTLGTVPEHFPTLDALLAYMDRLVQTFQPDRNTTPVLRVSVEPPTFCY